MNERRVKVANFISIKVNDELYNLVLAEAEKKGVKMIDVVVAALANHFKKPQLGIVPRLPPGKRAKIKVGVNGAH